MKIENAAVLQSKEGDTMVLQGVAATGRLSGMLFELTVEQRYRNPVERNLEVVYTFPLAWGAVLLGFDVVIGGKKLTAVAVEKKAAERRYEEAIAEGDSPIMVERAANGLYTVNLGNLLPGEEARITYKYAQAIGAEQGHLRLTVPTVIAPKYGDPRESGAQPHQVEHHSLLVEYPFSIQISVDGPLADAQIRSPSHKVSVVRKDGRAEVSLAQNAWLDRDFVLTLDGLPSLSAAVVAADGDGYVAMASFCPMPDAAREAAPRALKFLLDCSGSMTGDSMTVAKRAVFEILSRLRPQDCFSFSRFGSTCEHLFKEMQPAQGKYLADARSRLDSTDADLGGTEMEKALLSVYKIKGPADVADVLLITDGEIQAADALVKAARTNGQRVFAVGVGSAPAESLLRRLAEATGGACELVVPGDQIEAAAVRMFRRMQAPKTTDVRLEWPAQPLWTAGVPSALYGGDTVHVFAGFAAKPEGAVNLRFSAGREQTMSVVLSGEPAVNDSLARMATAARLQDGVADAEEVVLAVKYQLVTTRTNLIVVHQRASADKAKDLPALAEQAQMLAAGWGGTGRVADVGVACLSMDALQAPLVLRRSRPSAEASFQDTVLEKRARKEALGPEEFVASLAWEGATAEPRMPEAIGHLRRLGVPPEICDELERLKALGIKESVVVAAFLVILLTSSPLSQSAGRHLGWAAKALESAARGAPALFHGMAHVMSHCGPHHWPERAAWRSAFGG